jgi:hypothetical protein
LISAEIQSFKWSWSESRTAMKADLAPFYASALVTKAAASADKRLVKEAEVVSQSRYRRRLSRTPY